MQKDKENDRKVNLTRNASH